jgi:hypothetical protein
MITVNEKQANVEEFEVGTVIYDSKAGKDPKDCLILIVEGYDTINEGCFAGIYLKSLRYSDGLSKTHADWKLFTGSITIQND